VNIVIADPLPSSAQALLESVPGWRVASLNGATADAVRGAVADADALIVRSATRADAALIAAAPRLRVIARAGTGVDNIDLDAASARGILVLNAPGANSVSVAEHALALMLALARSVAAADAAMKAGRWEKKSLMGAELRGKTLGIVGLGRIGQEVASRASAFGMDVVAHDPFIAANVADDLGVELLSLDDLCARSDYITLHVPATAATRHLFDAARFARCRRGVRMINTARGELIDESALADAIESGQVGGAGLDVFEVEPPRSPRLTGSPRVVATPHIAASTSEAQELVGVEAAASVRDYLREGIVRNAVNFPALSPEDSRRVQPFVTLADRLGALMGQLASGRIQALGIRYYGELASGNNEVVASAALAGLFRPILSSGVTLINARSVAAARGVEVIESRSSRARNFTSLLSVKLHTDTSERWVEGAVFEPASPRLVLLDGVDVEAPLEGTLLLICNNDQPGVIGDVGTLLGRHGLNIATFALGRGPAGAVGVVRIDESDGAPRVDEEILREIRALPAVRDAQVVRL
jgi:D-3-phosphoglycerate dehydrogenase